ncbi:hypothetical protein DLH77_02740 [Vibrio parahaemolyticus]|nr:hypothetical protein [Vibrio parahaemolyticus]EGQ8696258.1 hypothetical protein [Vibrio parahaemolyticus]EGQ8750182.1 hypothetical protein [Vibrio parahaemolyticus]EGQ8755171.1 hypothetical protein [Vibrio parahaemolyticus]EGQ8769861.1 hypothetical protein [Vibrio parahaemolyticus]
MIIASKAAPKVTKGNQFVRGYLQISRTKK